MLKVIRLNNKAEKYVSEYYWGWLDVFGSLEDVNNQIVASYTYLPNDYISPYKVDEFLFGGRCSSKTLVSQRIKEKFTLELKSSILFYEFAEIAENCIDNNKNGVCYFYEFNSTSSSIKDDREKMMIQVEWNDDYISIGEQILYYYKADYPDKNEIIKTLRYSENLAPPYLFGFISDYFPRSAVVAKDEAKKIFEGITIVFSGIYDGEGVMVMETKKGEGLLFNVLKELNIMYEYEEQI